MPNKVTKKTATIEQTGAAVIRAHLPHELHLQLIEETHEMLEAGAKIEDIIWHLSPSGGLADTRQEALAFLEQQFPEMAHLIRDLPARRDGFMFILYIGPEGTIGQWWKSVLTATDKPAA